MRVTRMESTTVMVKALLNDASISAAMAAAVVSTLEKPIQTPAPAPIISYRIHNKMLVGPMSQCCLRCNIMNWAARVQPNLPSCWNDV